MGKFKGTKGKWSVDYSFYRDGDSYLPIKSNIENREWIADVKGSHVNIGLDVQEMKANALLISKAPEILEMLESMNKYIKQWENKNYAIRLMAREFDIEKLIKESTTI